MTVNTLQAWNHDAGETCEIEVPTDRSHSCTIVGSVSAQFVAELLRAARWLTEEPGAVSMKLDSGWTLSR